MEKEKKERLKEYLHLANALLQSMNTSIQSNTGVLKYSSYKEFIRKYNQLAKVVSQEIELGPIIDIYNLENIPSRNKTLAGVHKELFESVYANLLILKALIETKIELKVDEITNLYNFIQANLRKVVFGEPKRELDIQNSLEQLFIGKGYSKGIDYDRETGRVKVSIKEVVPDFIFPKLSLALEVKFSKDVKKSKAIVDEINADIVSYSKKYPYLLFVVYDIGSIRDEIEFKQDLETSDNVSVIVIKH